VSGGVGIPFEIDRWMVVGGEGRGGGRRFGTVDICIGGECNCELIEMGVEVFEGDGGRELDLGGTEEGGEEGRGVRDELIPGNHFEEGREREEKSSLVGSGSGVEWSGLTRARAKAAIRPLYLICSIFHQ